VTVARARMIIEFADGRATYWETWEPHLAEVEHLAADRGFDWGPVPLPIALPTG
jgi:hypothetical protein